MRIIRTFFLLTLLIFFLSNCSTIKKGFESQRKNSTEEFLVEKKKPLVMPPNYDSLPVPNQNEKKNKPIESMIKIKDESDKIENDSQKDSTTENFILEKIKTN